MSYIRIPDENRIIYFDDSTGNYKIWDGSRWRYSGDCFGEGIVPESESEAVVGSAIVGKSTVGKAEEPVENVLIPLTTYRLDNQETQSEDIWEFNFDDYKDFNKTNCVKIIFNGTEYISYRHDMAEDAYGYFFNEDAYSVVCLPNDYNLTYFGEQPTPKDGSIMVIEQQPPEEGAVLIPETEFTYTVDPRSEILTYKYVFENASSFSDTFIKINYDGVDYYVYGHSSVFNNQILYAFNSITLVTSPGTQSPYISVMSGDGSITHTIRVVSIDSTPLIPEDSDEDGGPR